MPLISKTSFPRGLRIGLLVACVVGVLSAGPFTSPAFANDKAAADALFQQGRKLFDAKKFAEACEKFAESFRLDNATGTQLNLARCYETIGKTASAWANYKEAEQRAKKSGNAKRIRLARARIKVLKPKLSYLSISLLEPLDGITIKRDGTGVGSAQLGVELPIDPGPHEIVASAPGYESYRKSINVSPDGDHFELKIPSLVKEPSKKPEPKGDDDDDDDDKVVKPSPKIKPRPSDTEWGKGPFDGDDKPGPVASGSSPLFAIGLATTIVGGAVLVGGVVAGIVAKSTYDTSLESCQPDSPNLCSLDGVSTRDDAVTQANISTALVVVGGIAAVAGVVIIAMAPSDDGAAATKDALVLTPWASPYGAGIGFQGSF